MKPPPFLLGATLLFWGWQANLLWMGVLLGGVVELATVFKARWDFSDADFERIWTLCSLLLLATVLFAFTNNDGLSTFGNLMEDPNSGSQRQATVATARTASNVLRWLPMVFFPFLLAQTFSTRESIPLATISHILQRRWKIAQRLGRRPPPGRGFNVGYPYFCMTLLAASFHAAEDNTYFWGFCALLGWVFWVLRSRRYSPAVWVSIVLLAATAGYFGQRGLGQMQRYLENFNAQWLARFLHRSDDPFQSRTAIGRMGQLKLSNAIVIRLQAEHQRDIPLYLRDASYRRYERTTWFAGSSRDDFESVSEDPPTSGNWPLVTGKRAPQTVNIACYLDGRQDGFPAGLLPLPSGVARLDHLPAYGLKKNSAGSVVAQGPGFIMFDAHFGPGETLDRPPGWNPRRLGEAAITANPSEVATNSPGDEARSGFRRRRFVANEDIDVPPQEAAAIEAVAAELQLRERSDAEKLAGVAAFFSDKFTYSMWQGYKASGDTNETPLSRFLLKTRSGHCEYFATATVLLLRELGIPTRYATGYSVNETSGDGYVVRLSDAHAWTLVWDKEREIWTDFDTTPASWVAAERARSGPGRWLSDAWSRWKYEFSKFRYGQGKARQYLLWIVLPGLALLLYQIVFRRGRKRQSPRTPDEKFFANWPGLDSDFYRLEKQLAAHGVLRAAGEPLQDWLQRVLARPQLAALRAPLEAVLRLHYRHRFDPLGLSPADRAALQRETGRCLESLAQIGPAAGN